VLKLEPLRRNLEMVLNAFWEMHPMRFSQMGHRPLSISDVMIWCGFHAIDNVEFRHWLWWMVHRLDQVWLELAEQDRERRQQADEWMRKIED
jgi:hypothetical protein